jgi:hypothetical protein
MEEKLVCFIQNVNVTQRVSHIRMCYIAGTVLVNKLDQC